MSGCNYLVADVCFFPVNRPELEGDIIEWAFFLICSLFIEAPEELKLSSLLECASKSELLSDLLFNLAFYVFSVSPLLSAIDLVGTFFFIIGVGGFYITFGKTAPLDMKLLL